MIESKIFSKFTGSGVLAAFLFSGNSLNWSAVPESTGALDGRGHVDLDATPGGIATARSLLMSQPQ